LSEGEKKMAKTMSCRDVGPDCDFVARGESEDEIMGQVAEHARDAHGLDEVPPELAEKARAAIKDE
jgi:predicted small metal-binding protein